MSNKTIENKCKKIKLVLTDVDGVLTDGGKYYSKNGEVMKRFHVRDGMGVNLLLRNGIRTVIITKERSSIVQKWAKDMKIGGLLMGIKKKESQLSQICKKFNVDKDEISFIGDDVNDVELMQKIGLSAIPCDGNENVKHVVDYICKKKGGEGAFREFADKILITKFPNIKWY